MVLISLKCPYCGSEKVRKNGNSKGKQRYMCNNAECSHKTFYSEYKNKGYSPSVKQDIIKWSTDGAGVRAIARELGISQNTVISELKKRKDDRVCEQSVF